MSVHVFFANIIQCNDTQQDLKYIYPYKKDEFRSALGKRRKSEILSSSLLIRKAFSTVYGKDFGLYVTEYGKPLVKEKNVFISISHSGDIVMIALSDENVGCDIQKMEKGRDPEKLAKRFLSEKECENINNSEDKMFLFSKYWTYRESYCKMNGDGLARLNHRIKIEEDKIFIDNKLSGCKVVSGKKGDYVYSVCTEKENAVEYYWTEINR